MLSYLNEFFFCAASLVLLCAIGKREKSVKVLLPLIFKSLKRERLFCIVSIRYKNYSVRFILILIFISHPFHLPVAPFLPFFFLFLISFFFFFDNSEAQTHEKKKNVVSASLFWHFESVLYVRYIMNGTMTKLT